MSSFVADFKREYEVTGPLILLTHRLCFCEPTVDKLKLLAFCQSLYHTCVNDQVCVTWDGFPNPAQIVQERAHDLARHSYHLVIGG